MTTAELQAEADNRTQPWTCRARPPTPSGPSCCATPPPPHHHDRQQRRRGRTGIGGIVKQDRPAKGAGNIESPGAQDQYTFHAGEGQEVYLDVQECTSNGTLT